MPTLSDIAARPLSGLAHIDALVGDPVPWNALGRNVIYYSFDFDPGADPGETLLDPATLAAFNATQQAQARAVLAYVSQVTGIQFAEVAASAQADLHFASAALKDGYTSQDAIRVVDVAQGGQADYLGIEAWIWLDSGANAFDNATPLPGGIGYQSLLHEVGQVLGLKMPFEDTPTLPAGDQPGQDNTATTLMSWNDVGGPYTSYRAYDLAALAWLFGGDGLGGAYGASSPNKFIIGSFGADSIVGGAGDDKLQGAAGNDTIDGAAGIDTAVYTQSRAAYAIRHTADGYTVSAASGDEGTDTLVNVERLMFGDGMHVALDVHGNGGMAYRLYQAAFDRAPDLPGLGFQIHDLDIGLGLTDVAGNFIASPEFASRYGSLDDTQFVTQLYRNVLHREPDAQGLAYHVAHLGAGVPRSWILANFSESPENQANVIGTIQDGMDYTL